MPDTAASGVESALRLLEGRWKLVILFHLFGGQVQRFSDLEKLIPSVSQKMLAQQLRQLEADGIVVRTVYPQRVVRLTRRLGLIVARRHVVGRCCNPGPVVTLSQ